MVPIHNEVEFSSLTDENKQDLKKWNESISKILSDSLCQDYHIRTHKNLSHLFEKTCCMAYEEIFGKEEAVFYGHIFGLDIYLSDDQEFTDLIFNFGRNDQVSIDSKLDDDIFDIALNRIKNLMTKQRGICINEEGKFLLTWEAALVVIHQLTSLSVPTFIK